MIDEHSIKDFPNDNPLTDFSVDEQQEARRRSEAARELGRSRSPRKAASSRQNGKKGGRPKGFVPLPESRRQQSEAMKRYHQQKKIEKETGASLHADSTENL